MTLNQIDERLSRIEQLLYRLAMAPEPHTDRKWSAAGKSHEEIQAHNKQMLAEHRAEIKAFKNRQRRAA
jgi:hypothetical protein